LAHASTAQFTFSLWSGLSGWLGRHSWAGFFAGLSTLPLAIAWPELKEKMPKLRLPKTLQERLLAVETAHLPGIENTYSELTKHIEGLRAELGAHSEWINAMRTFNDATQSGLKEVETRYSVVAHHMDAAEQGLQDHLNRIAVLERDGPVFKERVEEETDKRLKSIEIRLTAMYLTWDEAPTVYR
jgi:hypothetical protein